MPEDFASEQVDIKLRELRRRFDKLQWSLSLSEDDLLKLYGSGELTDAIEQQILDFRDQAGSEIYRLSETILNSAETSDGWLRLKAEVVIHYAEQDGDMVDFSALRLAEAVLLRIDPVSDCGGGADVSGCRLSKAISTITFPGNGD